MGPEGILKAQYSTILCRFPTERAMGIEQLILFIAVARPECFFRKRTVFSETACIYSLVVFIFYKNMWGQNWGHLGPTGWPFGWRFQPDHPMLFRPARSGAGACCSPVGLLDGLRGGICQFCPLALHLVLVYSERVHVLAVAHEHLQLPFCELPGLHADKSVPQLV